MTTTPAVLLEGTFATSGGVSYTSDQCVTALDKVTCTNESVGVATATIELHSADGSLTQTHTKAIQPGASWSFPDVVGQYLAVGGQIVVKSATASAIKARINGRKFT